MAYYPKSQIKTGLYTGIETCYFKGTSTLYVGPYWKTSKGEIFSGEGPNDPTASPLELVIVDTQENKPSRLDFSTQAQVKEGPKQLIVADLAGAVGPGFEKQIMLRTYLSVRNQSLDNLPVVDMPFYNAQPPTQEDYAVGEFRRYFCKKTNELMYLEIDKSMYDKLKSKSTTSAWTLFTPFNLSWQIAGDKQQVQLTNKRITELEILRKDLKLFAEYLKNDYLKYYKG